VLTGRRTAHSFEPISSLPFELSLPNDQHPTRNLYIMSEVASPIASVSILYTLLYVRTELTSRLSFFPGLSTSRSLRSVAPALPWPSCKEAHIFCILSDP